MAFAALMHVVAVRAASSGLRRGLEAPGSMNESRVNPAAENCDALRVCCRWNRGSRLQPAWRFLAGGFEPPALAAAIGTCRQSSASCLHALRVRLVVGLPGELARV